MGVSALSWCWTVCICCGTGRNAGSGWLDGGIGGWVLPRAVEASVEMWGSGHGHKRDQAYGEKATFSKQDVTLLTVFATYVTSRLMALEKLFHTLCNVDVDELPTIAVTLIPGKNVTLRFRSCHIDSTRGRCGEGSCYSTLCCS
jgi:hypothetical protein